MLFVCGLNSNSSAFTEPAAFGGLIGHHIGPLCALNFYGAICNISYLYLRSQTNLFCLFFVRSETDKK